MRDLTEREQETKRDDDLIQGDIHAVESLMYDYLALQERAEKIVGKHEMDEYAVAAEQLFGDLLYKTHSELCEELGDTGSVLPRSARRRAWEDKDKPVLAATSFNMFEEMVKTIKGYNNLILRTPTNPQTYKDLDKPL